MTKEQLDVLKLVLNDVKEPVKSFDDPVKLVRLIAYNEGLDRAIYLIEKAATGGFSEEYLKHLQTKRG